MKVKIKSVLKTVYHDVECFDQQQIITRSGNTLCIKEIGKNQCQFICLHPELSHLFSFKPATSRKGVFTAERIKNGIDLAYYNLKGDRKSISLSDNCPFFNDVDSIEVLVDEYDNNIVYGGAKNKEGACVFMADINKGKLLASGFMTSYEDLKVDIRDNLSLSVCCNNGNNNLVRHLRYNSGQWEATEEPFKKIQVGVVFQHEILPLNRTLFATKQFVYHFEETDLLQTIEMEKGQKIRQMMKIHRGLLLFGQENSVQVFIQDSDQVTLLSKGHLKLMLQPQDKICKILLSHNNEQVIVRTQKNSLYIWKCQHLDLDSNHFDFSFLKVESSCASSHEGHISISTGKKYCMLAGIRNVTLWSVQKNEFVLSSEYINNAEAEKTKKIILCCAINPDGNSFMIAFEDKIRVYQILLTKFKFYAEFPIKRCCSIVYSHGGQLVACRYGRGINSCIAIINTLRLVEVGVLKIQSDPHQIVWNELDDELIVATESNSIQLYTVADNNRINLIRFDSPVTHVRIDYKMRKILVSAQKKIYVISNGAIVDSFVPPFDDFHYIFPLYGIYMISTYGGVLHWSSSLRFQTYNSYSLFTNTPFHMVCRNSYLLAYSSFQQVQILQCIRPNHFKKKSLNDDIVMVQKDEINEFYDKIKLLQSNFDMLTSATQIKLEQERNNYQNAVNTFKKQFVREIKTLNQTFNDLTNAKVKQERETEMTFEEIQVGQVRNIHQIQHMYERKCSLLQQKLLNLEQHNLSQKHQYQNLLSEVQSKYHREVNIIRSTYERKSKQDSLRAQQQKNHILQVKQKMEFKLFELEEQNQFAMQNIQENKDTLIKKLNGIVSTLESQLQEVEIKNQNVIGEFERLKEESQCVRNQLQRLNGRHEESLNRIKMLEREVKSKEEVIQERNMRITELNHQIQGLEKAKYVLSFRTAETRKELEPKQALADRLKSEISKLDEQFKQSNRKIFQLTQRIQKLSKINQTLKRESNEARLALKLKDRVHSQLCSQISKIFTTIDPGDWNSHFTKLYKSFIKQQRLKSKQLSKKDSSSQQVNRHLMHVQMSLQQVATSNDKILRGKQKDITRRMKQNSDLLFEINVMKQKEKDIVKINNQLIINNQRLQKQVDQSYNSTRKNSTRAQTSNTGMTRRAVVSRDALYSREKSLLMDRAEGSKEKDLKEMLRERSRIGSTHKTLMYRDDRRQKSAKFFDLAKDLQSARNTIQIQQQMLEELNLRLFGMEERKEN